MGLDSSARHRQAVRSAHSATQDSLVRGFSIKVWKPSRHCQMPYGSAHRPANSQACVLCSRIRQRGPTWPLPAAGVMVGESSSSSSSKLSRSDMARHQQRGKS